MAITFTRRATTIDAATDVATVASSTVVGSAVQVRGRAQFYEQNGLNLSTMPTLLFTPSTYGEVPEPGDRVEWPEDGDTYVVKAVEVIAPDGVVIAARVVIAR